MSARRSYCRSVTRAAIVGVALLRPGLAASARDLAFAPLLDGERYGLLNNWGGPLGSFNTQAILKQPSTVRDGQFAYEVRLGTLAPGTLSFAQTFAGEPTADVGLRPTRDLTRYEAITGYFRHDGPAPLTLRLELKDYRDSQNHRASIVLTAPPGPEWTRLSASLDLGAGWQIDGTPDLSRVYVATLAIDPQPAPLGGSYYFDDLGFVEAAGPLPSKTAPLATLVARVAERQFAGLWTSRRPQTGLIPNQTDAAGVAALNTTAGTLWMLPGAVRRGWVEQAEADATVGRLVEALAANLDQTTYLPTRFLQPATAAPLPGEREESSVDAAFMALALQRYQTLPTTDATLAARIDAVRSRFRFEAFAAPTGFKLAYFPATGFVSGTYDGYTNEGKVIALAAALAPDGGSDLADFWNDDVLRTRAFLEAPGDNHLVHTHPEFRAPFAQALLNLFVDTSDRGVDSFPIRSLATNPWQNFVRYQREAARRLTALGREGLWQPDAGSGAPAADYEQYSLYHDFGQPDLFMPWSAAFALWADAEGAEAALRQLLATDGMLGPLGMADSVRWTTGAAQPYFVANLGDNWNTALMTMTLMELLDRWEGVLSASQSFAQLPSVRQALDTVFLDGDITGDGVTDGADLVFWQRGFGGRSGGIVTQGDADGNGAVDGADLLRWQRGFGRTQGVQAGSVPEPGALALWLAGGWGAFAHERRRARSACV